MRRRAEICEAQAPLLTQSQSLALVIRHPRPISSKQLIGAQTIAVSLARGRRACALETERKAGWLAPRSWTGRGDWNKWAWSLLPLRQESFSFLLIRALPFSLSLFLFPSRSLSSPSLPPLSPPLSGERRTFTRASTRQFPEAMALSPIKTRFVIQSVFAAEPKAPLGRRGGGPGHRLPRPRRRRHSRELKAKEAQDKGRASSEGGGQ